MNSEWPLISVIIPCYNYAHFLSEAVESVLRQKYTHFECIIVNDGSSDNTEEIARTYCKRDARIKYIHQENQGLSSARNTGISIAGGKYILPLDADDKISPDYASKAVAVLEGNPNIGIVYCDAQFFGSTTTKFKLKPYAFPEILIANLIFASSFFRKEDWASCGGYNKNMKLGWEDYDFWLSIIELKREVYKIPEVLFYYRQGHSSMRAVTDKNYAQIHAQIAQNHPALYLNNIWFLFQTLQENRAGRLAFEEIERTWSYRCFFKHFLAFKKSAKSFLRTAAGKAGIIDRIIE